jgi:hypothetical protein
VLLQKFIDMVNKHLCIWFPPMPAHIIIVIET